MNGLDSHVGLKRLLYTPPQGSPNAPRPFLEDPVVRAFLTAMVVCFALTWGLFFLGAVTGSETIASIGQALFGLGALDAGLWHGEIWRLFTCMFLHGSVSHLVGNAMFMVPLMWVMRRWTTGNTWLLAFTVTGIAGSLLEIILHPQVSMVGASGGIAGLWGAALVVAWRLVKSGKQALFALVVMFVLGFFLFQEVAGTLAAPASGVAHMAHLGGLLSGVLLGRFLKLREDPPAPSGLD